MCSLSGMWTLNSLFEKFTCSVTKWENLHWIDCGIFKCCPFRPQLIQNRRGFVINRNLEWFVSFRVYTFCQLRTNEYTCTYLIRFFSFFLFFFLYLERFRHRRCRMTVWPTLSRLPPFSGGAVQYPPESRAHDVVPLLKGERKYITGK